MRVADNTGAREILCIRVRAVRARYARVGDVIVPRSSRRHLEERQRGDVVHRVVVRTKKSRA